MQEETNRRPGGRARTAEHSNVLSPGSHPGETADSGLCRCTALERQISDLNSRLSAAMQQASMAEVAGTALHNVGNVLNTVNVSASVIAQRLRESRIRNLDKALALLREHRGELGNFLDNDPKGRMLPNYLETLGRHLGEERAELLREMDLLSRSIEHMKEIVSVQQSYARKCGVLETLKPAELVEDALKMNRAAVERHGVSIVREFAETPAITVDKHKVLQILVNLIRNAKYAMDELGKPDKVLTLGIHASGTDKLAITVRDNGIGIPRENMARIFHQGFTTKRDGHGFGLHSGVLAAAEMGGELSVKSDGIGKGATFCLELPLTTGTGTATHHAGGNDHNITRT
ncbi:MAG TPA: HAMP domain-containing sensor histidine kinase [Verrucomicrobiae bacterium]|nr:HAMP domain-containing sensor histidine kinase [Verrucomicrobiae bacterium]